MLNAVLDLQEGVLWVDQALGAEKLEAKLRRDLAHARRLYAKEAMKRARLNELREDEEYEAAEAAFAALCLR